MTKTIRVLLAADQPLVRDGIRFRLMDASDIVVVGEACDFVSTSRLCHELAPDVLLLDLSMAGRASFKLVDYLQTRLPSVRVLVVTPHTELIYIQSVLPTGVAGCIVKEDVPELIIGATRSVAAGKDWFSPTLAEKLLRRVRRSADRDNDAPLTDRQLAMLQLVVAGKCNRQLGYDLGISAKTVEKGLRNLYKRLGVDGRVEAAVMAVRLGLA